MGERRTKDKAEGRTRSNDRGRRRQDQLWSRHRQDQLRRERTAHGERRMGGRRVAGSAHVRPASRRMRGTRGDRYLMATSSSHSPAIDQTLEWAHDPTAGEPFFGLDTKRR